MYLQFKAQIVNKLCWKIFFCSFDFFFPLTGISCKIGGGTLWDPFPWLISQDCVESENKQKNGLFLNYYFCGLKALHAWIKQVKKLNFILLQNVKCK